MTLEVGQPAPEFEVRDQHGQAVSLSSFRGQKGVVIVFYPFAFSRVCTGELREIRDNLPLLAADEVQVLAISCDPMFSLRALADHDGIDFPLLSDFWPHGEVSSAYDVFDSERGCSARSTFIVDKDGVLRWSVHNAIADARDLQEYTRVLAELAA